MKTIIKNKEELLSMVNQILAKSDGPSEILEKIGVRKITERDLLIYEKFINDTASDVLKGRNIISIMDELDKLAPRICKTASVLLAAREHLDLKNLNVVENSILSALSEDF